MREAIELGLRLGWGLWAYWSLRGQLREATGMAAPVAHPAHGNRAHAVPGGSPGHGRLVHVMVQKATRHRPLALLEESLALARDTGQMRRGRPRHGVPGDARARRGETAGAAGGSRHLGRTLDES